MEDEAARRRGEYIHTDSMWPDSGKCGVAGKPMDIGASPSWPWQPAPAHGGAQTRRSITRSLKGSRRLGMILAVAVLAAVCGSVHAQTADAAPELQADDLYAWLYAVGKGGTVLKSENCGKTWDDISAQTGVTEDLFAVDFADARSGYVVGNKGTVISTTDIGVTWETSDFVKGEADEAASPTPKLNLTGLFVQGFPGPVMTVGANGLLARSSDDVSEWTVESVWCSNMTSDCKAHPYSSNSVPEANYNRLGKLNGVRFKDSRNGVVVGDNGVILLTQDGENDELTFTKINIFGDTPKPWPNMNSIDMDDLGNMIIVGDKGVAILVNYTSNDIDDQLNFNFICCNAAEGCPGSRKPPYTLSTSTGGCSLALDVDLRAANSVRLEVFGKTYHVVAGTGGFVAMLDESLSPYGWKFPARIPMSANESITGLYASTSITNIVVTDKGSIFRTQDNGATPYKQIAIGSNVYSFNGISGRNTGDQSAASTLASQSLLARIITIAIISVSASLTISS